MDGRCEDEETCQRRLASLVRESVAARIRPQARVAADQTGDDTPAWWEPRYCSLAQPMEQLGASALLTGHSDLSDPVARVPAGHYLMGSGRDQRPFCGKPPSHSAPRFFHSLASAPLRRTCGRGGTPRPELARRSGRPAPAFPRIGRNFAHAAAADACRITRFLGHAPPLRTGRWWNSCSPFHAAWFAGPFNRGG